MNRILVSAALAVGVLGGGLALTAQKPANDLASFAASAQDTGEVDTSMVADMVIGNPDATVTVVEYASFTCPHCQRFHETVYEDLKKNYIDTGKIKFEFREVYFDQFGLRAGLMARCGGDTRYFGIVDMLFDQQKDWLSGSDADAIIGNLEKIGKTAGLSGAELEQCMNDSDMAKAMVAVFQQNAEADNVKGTPTFIINGETYSNMNYDDFSAILDEKLAE